MLAQTNIQTNTKGALTIRTIQLSMNNNPSRLTPLKAFIPKNRVLPQKSVTTLKSLLSPQAAVPLRRQKNRHAEFHILIGISDTCIKRWHQFR